MKKFIFILILTSFNLIFSQNEGATPYPSSFFFDSAVRDINNVLRNTSKNNEGNYIGSPYLEKEFSQGILYDSIQNKSYSVLLRYNIYNDLFEVKKSENSIFNLAKRSNFTFNINERKFVLLDYFEEYNNAGYFEVLLDGQNMSLYKKYKRILQPPVKAQSSYEKDKPAKFINSESLFYKSGNSNKLNKLPKKKKELYTIFKKKIKEVENYISKNKLNIKKESDLIKIIEFYNALN